VCFLCGLAIGVVVPRLPPVAAAIQRAPFRDWIPGRAQIPAGAPSAVAVDWDLPVEDYGQLALFLLIGQSNMSGRGSVESVDAPRPHPSIYTFNKDFRWHPAVEPLGTMPNEVDPIAKDGGTGVGPGLAFARHLVEAQPSLKIGLIPCARGASSIGEWHPHYGQNTLYGACLKRVRAASVAGHVAGILVSQGESDADDPDLYPGRPLSAKNWATQFEKLVTALRTDLGNDNIPLVYAQLGTHPGPVQLPHWEEVRQQQANARLHAARMISTEDLELDSEAHYETKSYLEIGRRFATAYLSLTRGDGDLGEDG
jgi:hypothetical protein